jgi:hypothetical protein
VGFKSFKFGISITESPEGLIEAVPGRLHVSAPEC